MRRAWLLLGLAVLVAGILVSRLAVGVSLLWTARLDEYRSALRAVCMEGNALYAVGMFYNDSGYSVPLVVRVGKASGEVEGVWTYNDLPSGYYYNLQSCTLVGNKVYAVGLDSVLSFDTDSNTFELLYRLPYMEGFSVVSDGEYLYVLFVDGINHRLLLRKLDLDGTELASVDFNPEDFFGDPEGYADYGYFVMDGDKLYLVAVYRVDSTSEYRVAFFEVNKDTLELGKHALLDIGATGGRAHVAISHGTACLFSGADLWCFDNLDPNTVRHVAVGGYTSGPVYRIGKYVVALYAGNFYIYEDTGSSLSLVGSWVFPDAVFEFTQDVAYDSVQSVLFVPAYVYADAPHGVLYAYKLSGMPIPTGLSMRLS